MTAYTTQFVNSQTTNGKCCAPVKSNLVVENLSQRSKVKVGICAASHLSIISWLSSLLSAKPLLRGQERKTIRTDSYLPFSASRSSLSFFGNDCAQLWDPRPSKLAFQLSSLSLPLPASLSLLSLLFTSFLSLLFSLAFVDWRNLSKLTSPQYNFVFNLSFCISERGNLWGCCC